MLRIGGSGGILKSSSPCSLSMSSLPLSLKEYKELAHALLFTYMTAHAYTHLVRLGGTANDDDDGKTKILSLENIKIYKHLADT